MKANAILIAGIAALAASILASAVLILELDIVLVLALVSFPVLAIVFGHLVRRRIRKSAEPSGGRGRVVIGLILSYASVLFVACVAFLVVFLPGLTSAVSLTLRPANCEIELEPEDLSPANRVETARQISDAVRSRLRGFGVPNEVVVNPSGTILVRLYVDRDPRLDANRERTLRSFFEQGILTLHVVHRDNDTLASAVVQGRAALPPGFRVVESRSETLLVHTAPEWQNDVARARATRDTLNQPAVIVSFGARGRDALARFSRANVGQRLAIALDGVVITAPTITEPIEAGEALVSRGFTNEEAVQLANLLNAGVLPQRLRVIKIRYMGEASA
jgi:hypothetical protein